MPLTAGHLGHLLPVMRRSLIEDELRRRIREGVYAPGARMPSHRDLLKELDVSSATLQLAFDRLIEQGYVEPRGAQGTFVSELLPHQSTYAMVLPDDAERGTLNRYWGTAKRVAEEWKDSKTRIRVYGISGQRSDSAGHRQLCQDLAEGALAGVIFIHPPFFLEGSPVFASPIPRVCIGGGALRDLASFGCSLVTISDDDVPSRIVHHFQAAGRRRMAALTAVGISEGVRAEYQPLLRTFGLETRPEWWLGLPIEPLGAVSARTVTHLLLSGTARQRPDCLLITDDNLVPHATAGVIDAGLDLPQDLSIAAHANYPWPTLATVPCLRFGPDMHAQVRAAVAEIDRLTAGGTPGIVNVPMDFRVT